MASDVHAILRRVEPIFNRSANPREEKPIVDTCVVHAMLKPPGAFEESVKKYPQIPMRTPDPYWRAIRIQPMRSRRGLWRRIA